MNEYETRQFWDTMPDSILFTEKLSVDDIILKYVDRLTEKQIEILLTHKADTDGRQ